MTGSTITTWGVALPDRVLTNGELERRLDTTDAWIMERTGIRERHVGGTTVGLAVEAGRRALERGDVDVSSIDLLVVSTNTPDQAVPVVSAVVQHQLGLRCGVLDISSGCSGFVYGLVVAEGLLASGFDRVLLVASDTVSRIVDPADRSTVVLFGDAAAAIVLEASPGPRAVLGFDLGADGSCADILYREHGQYLVMNGREVFRRAVRASIASAEAALGNAKVGADQIALFVPHQGNLRIIEAVAKRLGFSEDRTMSVVERTGNTSSASIPYALAEAADTGRLQVGDLVLLAGFGAGMTWASAVVRWGRELVAP
ncbi:MAG: 3-oxoacyl-ACP synthase III family protein [Acidimicrobiales bacterium]